MADIKYTVTAVDGSTMTYTLLEDGRVKIETGAVGPTVHTNAEGMLKEFNRLIGGTAKRESKGDHAHSHGEHTHEHHHDA